MDDIEKIEIDGKIGYTMGLGTANLYAFVLAIPIIALILIPAFLIWSAETIRIEIPTTYFLLVLIVGIIIHELLHGLTWAYFAPSRLKSIKYGVKWKYLTPYCHCKEPLKVKHYKLGAVMPLIVLGIIPSIIGLIIGNGYFLFLGAIFSVGAGGDIIGLFMLRKLDNNAYVSDHPDKLGFIIETE